MMTRLPRDPVHLLLAGLTVLLLLRFFHKRRLPRCSSSSDWLTHHGACGNTRRQGPTAYWRMWPTAILRGGADSMQQTLQATSWFGNSSEVGLSPYDFKPRPLRPGERRTRILFLLDFNDYLERMNSHSYEM